MIHQDFSWLLVEDTFRKWWKSESSKHVTGLEGIIVRDGFGQYHEEIK